MYRSLNQSLINWKSTPGRQPLLLRGARQTGKTYLVEHFGQANFVQTLNINFEKEKRYSRCFDSLNPKKIIQEIELLTNQSIQPGTTLLFLDEIQECPNAIKALRYFFEEMPELHIIGAGSLLEFALSSENFSMPVGRVCYRYLYPLSFSEMLKGLGYNQLYNYLKQLTPGEKIPLSVHHELLEQLQIYFILGGMPQVLNLYSETKKLTLARQAQSSILASYRDDFGKYASQVQRNYCERVFDKSFELIAKNFKYTDIDPDMDYRSLKLALGLLIKANILTPVYYSKATGLPLSATRVEKKYKLLFLDLGLVQAAERIPPELLLKKDIMQINRGAITEQYVGQQLLSCQPDYERADLFYWQRDSLGSQAEIDYVFAVNDLLIPLEVKSGATGRLKSLQLFMQSHQSKVGIKISTDEYSTSEKIWSIPLYLVEEIPRLINEAFYTVHRS